MLVAMICPPKTMVSNTSCRQKPSAMPMTTCCAVTTRPAIEKADSCCGMTIFGARIRAMAPASTMRIRTGTVWPENTGATIRQDPTRMNGQSTWSSQVSSCPVVRLIIAAPGSIDQARNTGEQLARVAHEHLDHPGAGKYQRGGDGRQLRDE